MGRRSRYYDTSSFLLLWCTLVIYVCPSQQFQIDNIGRVVRGHLDTLYDLRNKLGGKFSTTTATPSSTTTTVTSEPTASFIQRYRNSNSNPQKEGSSSSSFKKETRTGYSFHYSPAEVQHPSYFPAGTGFHNSHQHDFHNRMGKAPESVSSQKWKQQYTDKLWDKYPKHNGYKSSSSFVKDNIPPVNSFNVYQHTSPAYSNETTATTREAVEVRTTSLPVISSTTPSTTAMTPSSLDLSPIKALGQGLNSAMTKVLTERLMGMLDSEVPENILKPLKHLVASGNRMVDYWDKRTNARDGKVPGIVELLGYGIDQLKRFRDGQHLRSTDNVTDIMSASKTLIQGMITVKKLTNRVLGYDTDEDAIESRGGYGHDSYASGGGWGHHVSYGGSHGGLDPFALLAALAFGAFLLQLCMTMMTGTSARALDVSDMNTPLLMSDFHMPSFMTVADKIFGTRTVRSKREVDQDESSSSSSSSPFSSIVDKLDGIFKTYQTITEKPKCSRLYLCRIAVQDALGNGNSLISQLYLLGLGHLTKDKSATEFVKSIQSRIADGEDVNCDSIVKECVPRELKQKM